ncbi:MAG: flagellar hook-associated protein FlgK [Gemmatimonadetes bacterium]|nr:flagellar hook-associated protein FlgK [Gemmatimonadota bacterium]MBK6843583.1 flagellar hook-associated protein FlgK [Gemmatimonadota bacterium]MBK8646486.1 flagellar hook-associated protein FlgK [Gemmatimonadota bacterium]MBP9105348.1 flagellar hook-associated protein FlgK [Gemmatimonadaceae bacterium]
MPSIGSILSIARSAIASHQVAIQTVSQNIANAETEGYSRQRAELYTSYPQRFPFYTVGTGVEVKGVIRMRDELLDASFRREVGNRDGFNVRTDLLGEVEAIIGEPTDTGLANTLDQFWNSWNDLANNPSNATAQNVVRQRGQQVAYTFNTYATRIDDLANRTRTQLSGMVDEINTLSGQVASLNRQITSSEVTGQQSPDLRDARDRVADQLAKMAGVRVEMQSNGSMGIYLGSMMLVDSTNARQLDVRVSGATTSIGFTGDPDPALGVGGKAGQMMGFVNSDVPTIRGRLDSLARGLVNGVNDYHASGWTAAGDALGNANWVPANGPTGSRVNFFDAAFTTGGTIRLSAEVTANAAVIASGDVQNAPGNNTLALALGALRDDTGMAALQARMGANFATQIGFASGESYGDHYSYSVTNLGVQAADARNQYEVYDTLAMQSENRRSSVSGVSIDEELTLMLRHQQAYTAASRLVKAADEMAQTILNMI